MKKIIFGLVCLGLLAAGQPALAKGKAKTFTLTGYLTAEGNMKSGTEFIQTTIKNTGFYSTNYEKIGRKLEDLCNGPHGGSDGDECRITIEATLDPESTEEHKFYTITKLIKIEQTRKIKYKDAYGD